MSRPTSITFGAVRWKIKWTRNLGERAGETDRDRNLITICTDQGRQRQRSTLVHEAIGHGVLAGSPLRSLPWWTEEIEEQIVLEVERGVLELLVRPENATAIDWVRS